MYTIQNYSKLRSELALNADDEYREFAMKGIPCERPFIGVRIPQIREIVAKVPPEKIPEFLASEPVAIEEVLARGMLVCRLPYAEMLKQFDSQINCIDNWCTCDTFCSGVAKLIKKKSTEFFETKIDKLLTNDSPEFTVRVGLVLLKCAYIEPEWLQVIFDRIENLANRDDYYIKMAIAWLLCDCFVKYPTATIGYMLNSNLPTWTFNKTISKIYMYYFPTYSIQHYITWNSIT